MGGLYYIGFVLLFILTLIYVSIYNKKRGKVRNSNDYYDEDYIYDLDVFLFYNKKNEEDISATEKIDEVINVEVDKDDNKAISTSTENVKKKRRVKEDKVISPILDSDEIKNQSINEYLFSISDINSDKFTTTEANIITDKINDSIKTKNSDILIIIDNKTNSVEDVLFESFSRLKQDIIISNIIPYITKEKERYTLIYIAPFGVIKGYLNEKIKLNKVVQ